MNGKAVKGVRRDIRRAVGAEALQLVDAHTANLSLTQTNVEVLHQWVKKLDDEAIILRSDFDATRRRLDVHIGQRFTDRFRWLFLGR